MPNLILINLICVQYLPTDNRRATEINWYCNFEFVSRDSAGAHRRSATQKSGDHSQAFGACIDRRSLTHWVLTRSGLDAVTGRRVRIVRLLSCHILFVECESTNTDGCAPLSRCELPKRCAGYWFRCVDLNHDFLFYLFNIID